MAILDHVVYVCRDLVKTKERFENLLGIQIEMGGKHKTKGTHNALFRLGEKSYFELLAPDPERDPEINLEWLGTNNTEIERISRWCISPNDITEALAFLNLKSKWPYQIYPGSRVTTSGSILKWKLALSSYEAEVDVFPFLIDWGKSIHPAQNMKQQCEVLNIELYHSCPEKIQSIVDNFGLGARISKSVQARIAVTLKTPKGEITI